MALTFSSAPYFNDYDPANKEYDVLVRPGYSLQARELNALQSILQEQVRRFGKHVFKEGSMVIPGQIVIDQSVQYVKVNPTYSGNPVAWELLDPNSETNNGTPVTVEGVTSGIQAKVIAVDSTNSALYVKYLGTGSDDITTTFQDAEVIKLLPSNTNIADAIASEATGLTAAAAISEGVYFIFGRFVSVDPQYLILAPFDPNPSVRVGLQATETIVTPEDDPSLTDNASGTPNYAAPGAHRYKIELILTKKDPLPTTQEEVNNNTTSVDDDGFVELMRLETGVVQHFVDKTLYAEIETMVARRMYDTNGDFTVRPFKFSVREHLDNGSNNGVYSLADGGDATKVSLDIGPGKAYVFGHEIETLVTNHVPIDKARETSYFPNARVRAYLGNYFRINRMFGLPTYDEWPVMNLYDVAISTDGVLPVVPAIGTAVVRGLEFEQGSFGAIGAAGPVFKLYVTSVNLNTGKKLTDIRSLGVSDGTLTTTANVLHELDLVNVVGNLASPAVLTETGTTNTETVYAWNTSTNYVLTLPSNGKLITANKPVTSSLTGSCQVLGRSVLFETANNSLLFSLPQASVSTVRDKSDAVTTIYSFRKTFSPASETLGRVTFSTGVNEAFASVSVSDFVATIETGVNAGTLINVAAANPALDNALTQLSFDAPAGTTVKLSATIVKTAATERTKTLKTHVFSISSNVPETINLEKCDIQNVQIFEGTDVTGTDIRNRYYFDNGQRDNYYDFGILTLKPGSQNPSQVYVVVMYFDHGSGDYFSVDSYRNIGGADNWYSLIPTFVSQDTGLVYPLADYLDFRSKRDESDQVNLVFPNTVGKLVKPNDDIITDFSYYLARVDKVYLDGSGYFRVIEGTPAIEALPPEDPKDGMLLATLWLRPYTYTVKDVTMKLTDNRRYTMRDIGKLEKRIDNLEHYMALSLLEKDTASFSIPDSVTGLDRFKNGFVVDAFGNYEISDVANSDCAFSIDAAAKELRPMFNSDSFEMEYVSAQSSDVAFRDMKASSDLITLPYTEVPVVSQLKASDYENVNPYNVFKFIGTLELNPATDTWKDTVNAPDINIQDNSQYDAVMAQMGGQKGNGVIWDDWRTEWTGVDVNIQAGPVRSEVRETVGPAPVPQNNWGDNRRVPVVGDLVQRGGVVVTLASVDPVTNIAYFSDGSSVPYAALAADQFFENGADAGITRVTRNVQDIVRTTTTTSRQTRKGVETNVVVGPTKVAVDNKIIGTALDPWMRSRTIQWTAKRLKPSTRHYIFFDDKDVTAYNSPSTITTDATGTATGTFTIPAKTFRVGRRVLKICDDAAQRPNFIESSAENQYNASGLIETNQKTITSTREARIEKRSVSDTRIVTDVQRSVSQNVTESVENVGGGGDVTWIDPLAQSFLVNTLPGGYFLTGFDLFFKKKDANIPITLQIREMENGIPTQRVVPFGEIIQPAASVNVSSDAKTATRFSFPSPVYLKSGHEYCFVLMANSDNYEVWVAKIGNVEINTSNLISTTPYAGVLFKSKNASTWTPDQTEVFKFVMYRAKFDTTKTGKAYFANPTLPAHSLESLKWYTHNGKNVVRIYHRNHGMSTGSKVTVTIPNVNSNWTANFNGIPVTDIVPTINGDKRTAAQPSGVADTVLGSRTYTIANVELDSYTISITDGSHAAVNATSSGYTGVEMTVTENRLVDIMMPNIQQMKLANTDVRWYYRGVTGQSTHGTQTPYIRQTSGAFPYRPMELNQNIVMDAPIVVASEINETQMIRLGSAFDNKSLVFYAEMTSAYDNLSPVIDVQRISAITVSNRIDNRTAALVPAPSETGVGPLYIAETAARGATAPHRYIHRAAGLEAASNSIHVILSVMRPSEATVDVWYRVSPAETNVQLAEAEWVQMTPTGDMPIATSRTDFRDVTYAADDIGKFTSFQVKIVTRSTNSSRTAVIKDFRAIALDS